MEAYIQAISYYLPERVVTNEELVAAFPEWNTEKVSKKTGIEERHRAGDGETAVDMAYMAASHLFKQHPEIRENVDFILLCTQSPDFKLPTSACILQQRLELPTTIGALDFNLGCSGYVYGLALAKGLLLSGIAHGVLLLTAETYSKYFHVRDKGNQSIFGDGAAATFISDTGVARIGEMVLGTDGSGAGNLQVMTGGARYPQPLHEQHVDENGYLHSSDHLYMNGPEIFNFTLDAVPPMLDECAAKNGLDKNSIDLFVLHQANKHILDTIRKIYGIPKEKSYVSLAHVGNTVSSTLPIALSDAIADGTLREGMKVMTAGFGVGYSYGACLLEF